MNLLSRYWKSLFAVIFFFCGLLILFATDFDEMRPATRDGLFSPAESQDTAYIPQSESVKRFRFVNISPDSFQTYWLPEKEVKTPNLELPLFNDVILSMEITKIDISDKNSSVPTLSITGGIAGEQYAISTLTLKQDALFAQMTFPGKKYRIVPIQPPLHRIDELDTERSTDTFILN